MRRRPFKIVLGMFLAILLTGSMGINVYAQNSPQYPPNFYPYLLPACKIPGECTYNSVNIIDAQIQSGDLLNGGNTLEVVIPISIPNPIPNSPPLGSVNPVYQTGGTNINGGLLLDGTGGLNQGNYYLSGGSLIVGTFSSPAEENIGTITGVNDLGGVFSQSGGTNTVNGSLTVGSNGSYNLSEGSLILQPSRLGPSPENIIGLFGQTGGSNTTGSLDVAGIITSTFNNRGGPAQYELQGGNLTVGSIQTPGYEDIGIISSH